MKFYNSKKAIFASFTIIALALGMGSANAHVSVQSYGEKYYAGGGATLFLRVPHSKAGMTTNKLVVEMPENIGIVKPAHIGGWSESSTLSADGKNTLTLTWDNGNLPDSSFGDFGMKLTLPNTPGKVLYFKVVQYLSDGSTESWVQIPAGDGKSLDTPAPSYTIVDKATVVDLNTLKNDLDNAKAQLALLAGADAIITNNSVNVIADFKSTLKRKAYTITNSNGEVLYKGKLNAWGDFDINIKNKSIIAKDVLNININSQKAISVVVS